MLMQNFGGTTNKYYGIFENGLYNDFVTNSYGESWDSSSEKPWVLVQNQWVPVKWIKQKTKKTWSCKLNMFGPLCNQTVNLKTDAKTIYYMTVYWNLNIVLLYVKSTKKCIFQQRPQKSNNQYILPKNFQIDGSFACHELFCVLGDFYASATQPHRGNKITGNSYKFLERCWSFLVAGIWNTRTTGFIMLTLIYVISTALLSAESQTFLLAKRPQWRGARRNGCFRRLQTDLTKNKDFIAAFKMFRRFWLAPNTRFKYCS